MFRRKLLRKQRNATRFSIREFQGLNHTEENCRIIMQVASTLEKGNKHYVQTKQQSKVGIVDVELT